MFFVRKDNIGTILGTQKEFNACKNRGIEFFSETSMGGHLVWHYLWPNELLEPGVLASIQPQRDTAAADDALVGEGEGDIATQSAPTHAIWSQEVTDGDMVGEPVISAFPVQAGEFGAGVDWKEVARAKWLESVSQATA